MNSFTGYDDGRSRHSWGGEIAAGIVNAFPNSLGDISELKRLVGIVCDNPEGGHTNSKYDKDSLFIWGHNSHLTDYTQEMIYASDDVWKRVIRRDHITEITGPRIVFHTDKRASVGSETWGIAMQYGLESKRIVDDACRTMSKADILVVPVTQDIILGLSVKVGTGTSEVKLSQQSTSKTYDFIPVDFTLTGGLNMRTFENIHELLGDLRESDLRFEKTSLSERQFSKIGRRDRQFAVIKTRRPNEWREVVVNAINEADDILEKFGKAISGSGRAAKHNLRELLLKRLVGEVADDSDYEMWLSGINSPVNLTKILSNEAYLDPIRKVYTEMRPASGSGKLSLVVKAVNGDGEEFIVCKIEPGFDGGNANVSQTKGVIYYFQEGRQLGLPTVWNLLEYLWNYGNDR